MPTTPGTNAWRLAQWGEPCHVATATVPIYEGGPRVAVHPALVDAVALLGAICVRHGYVVRRIGCYNCRAITGGTVKSSHAWAISLDINDDTNPYRLDRLVTDMPRAMVDEIVALRTRDGAAVWRWGGDWDGRPETPHSNYDPMHFECIATPSELRAGFLAMVPSRTEDTGTPPPVRAWPAIRRGSDGPAVLMVQSLLGLERTTGAGHFGPRTEAAVRAYQRTRGLVVDGVVGLATWTALLTGQPPLAEGAPPPQKIANGIARNGTATPI